MGQIIVGVDESECAASALRFALREGKLHDWPVTAVSAWGFLDQHHALPDGASPHAGTSGPPGPAS